MALSWGLVLDDCTVASIFRPENLRQKAIMMLFACRKPQTEPLYWSIPVECGFDLLAHGYGTHENHLILPLSSSAYCQAQCS